MLTQEQVLEHEKALGAVSESIANFKRFATALDAFLKFNGLGKAEWEDLEPEVSKKGFTVAMFTLVDLMGESLLYCHLYTNGKVTGENFSGAKRGHGGIDCSWNEAVSEVMRTIGALQHQPCSRQRIDKILELLGEQTA